MKWSMKSFMLLLMMHSFETSFAQWEFGMGTAGMGPVDRFVGSVYEPSYGFCTQLVTSSMLDSRNKNKLQVGYYMDIVRAGKEKFDVKLDAPIDADGKTTFRNSSGGQHLFLRYGYLVNSNTMIFTDLIVGHRRFFSNVITGLKTYDPDFENDVQHIHSYHTFRNGVGFGIRYGFGEAFGLELRADYTRGGKATYFNLSTVEETTSSFTYEDESWAHTDLFVGSLQFSWKLFQPAYDPNYTPSYNNNSSSSSSNPYNRNRSSRSSTSSSPSKTKVKSSKPIEEKKKDDKINW